MTLVVPGVLILLVGMLILYSPSTIGQVAGLAGAKTTSTVASPPDILMIVPYGNFSSLAIKIPPNDTMTSTLSMDPAGLNIFVMDSANFSSFKSSQIASPISSKLNASSSVSITLTNNQHSSNNTFYLVVQNNGPAKQVSDVIVQYTITSQINFGVNSNLPLIVVIIGLALIVAGGLPIWRSKAPPPLPTKR